MHKVENIIWIIIVDACTIPLLNSNCTPLAFVLSGFSTTLPLASLCLFSSYRTRILKRPWPGSRRPFPRNYPLKRTDNALMYPTMPRLSRLCLRFGRYLSPRYYIINKQERLKRTDSYDRVLILEYRSTCFLFYFIIKNKYKWVMKGSCDSKQVLIQLHHRILDLNHVLIF